VKVLIESQYLPSISYFSLLAHSSEVWIESNENFEKQSYRNRCEILGSNKIQRLTIPVNSANSGLPIRKMSINYREDWTKNHWRAIQSAYGKAPFFDHYAGFIKSSLETKTSSLFELNQQLLTLCLKLAGIKLKLNFTEKFEKEVSDDILDMRSKIHPKKEVNTLTWFQPKSYYQVFGKDFVPNLSILDLLFCMGPESLMVIKQSGVFK